MMHLGNTKVLSNCDRHNCAENPSDAFGIRAVTDDAGRNVGVGNAVLEYLLAQGDELGWRAADGLGIKTQRRPVKAPTLL